MKRSRRNSNIRCIQIKSVGFFEMSRSVIGSMIAGARSIECHWVLSLCLIKFGDSHGRTLLRGPDVNGLLVVTVNNRKKRDSNPAPQSKKEVARHPAHRVSKSVISKHRWPWSCGALQSLLGWLLLAGAWFDDFAPLYETVQHASTGRWIITSRLER